MAGAIVSMADVRKQLSMMGYSNVPDKLVEEFLDEINASTQATPSAKTAVAPEPTPSPKTPPRASQRRTARHAPPSPLGPWQGDGEGEDEGVSELDVGPAVKIPEFPQSPFDDPARESFPPWYSTPPPGAAKEQPKKGSRSGAVLEKASKSQPASPPFEVGASPTSSLLKVKPGRVQVDRQTPGKSETGSVKRGKKKTRTRRSSLGLDPAETNATPASKSSAALLRTPGSESNSRNMPSAPSKKKTVSRTMASRSNSPKATPQRAGTSETPRPQTAPSPHQRHVSGQSVIYTKLNTPKQRASVRGLGFKKSDPVTMHQQHMKAWNSGSFALGRPSRDRGNQSARPRTAPSPRPHASEKGFVVPTEKRRDNLRWEIRMQMASPPH